MNQEPGKFRDVKYRKLEKYKESGSFVGEQFETLPPRIPWSALGLAFFLFVTGSCLLVAGSLLISGHLDVKYQDRTWPLLILGVLMFLPGAYHMRIAYYAFKGYPGYSFGDIPEFE